MHDEKYRKQITDEKDTSWKRTLKILKFTLEKYIRRFTASNPWPCSVEEIH